MRTQSLLSWLFGEWGCSRCERFHRRAQAAESASAKAVRQNSTEGLWKTVAYLKARYEHRLRHLIRERTTRRAIVDKIRRSGLVDTSHPGTEYPTGDVTVLVDRLLAVALQHKGDGSP